MAGENTQERVIPVPGSLDYTEVEIYVNGTRVKESAYTLQSVTINREVNKVPTARILIMDGDAAAEKFAVSESADFIPGNKIQLKISQGGNAQSLFEGVIVKHAIRASESGGACLLLDCRDACVKLTLGRKNKYFENVKDSDAISTVLQAAGVSGNVKATNVTHKELVQYYCTDWDFILSRAEVNSRLVLANNGKIDVIAPALAASPVLTLIYGATIEEMEVEMDARTQWQQVSAAAWDYAGQALASSDAQGDPFKAPGNISGSELAKAVSPADFQLRHSGLLSTAELKAWADACLLKSRMSQVRGRVKIKGSPLVKPGDTIALKGLGNRFNGLVFITGVRHEHGDGVWVTQLQIGLSPEWFHQQEDIIETPAAGLLPAVQGLQIGVVVQLENDPDGEHRVLVKLPLVDNQAKGTWARMASLDAGNNRGFFFRPEIGDEVIVGFINGDPRFAVILGMLHSSNKVAPLTAQDANHLKGLVTRSQMKVMYDDENKVMQLETPAGNKVTLSEKDQAINITDQHGNTIKMESGGITIKSIADITLEAAGNMTLKATGDFKAEGATMKLSSQATMEMSAQATAKLSASAMLELKGGIIKIN